MLTCLSLSILYYWLLEDSCVVCERSKRGLFYLAASLHVLWKAFFFWGIEHWFSELLSQEQSGSQQLWKTVHKHLTFATFFRKKAWLKVQKLSFLTLQLSSLTSLCRVFIPSRHSFHLSNIIASFHTYVLSLQCLQLVSTIPSSLSFSLWWFPGSCLFSRLSLWLQLAPFLPTPSQSYLFPVHNWPPPSRLDSR